MTVRLPVSGRFRLAAAVGLIFAAWAVVARGEIQPLKLEFAPDDDQNIYAPPVAPREDQGINQGGVNLDLTFAFMSDYVYRGVNHSDFPNTSKKANFQVDGLVTFNTGNLPHPFIGVFANVYDSDPVSRFQEIRPFAGLEWIIRPITADAGVNSYIYPEREHFNTSEVWAKLMLDDSVLFRTERPLFSPYFYAAYDYDKNNGFYVETGISHDLVFEDFDTTLTFLADVAYISHYRQQFIYVGLKSNGFQHYDVGMVGTYQLNNLLHVSRRFGEINLKGYLYYTAGIGSELLHTESIIWGGVGLQFKY